MRFETSSASRRLPTLNKSRIKQFSLATLDQGASSFTSLALQIALVSILGPKEFGSYAVAASIQGLAYLALYALLLEPMSVIGPQQAPSEEGRYLVRTFAALLLASLVAGALLVVTAGVCGLFDERLAYAMAGGIVGLPGIAIGWFARSASYVKSRPGLALVNSVTASVLLLIGLVALYQSELLSAGSGLALIGIASGAAACLPLRKMGVGAADTLHSLRDGSWRLIVTQHRPLARWGLLNALSVYASRDLYAPILAIAGGLELAALHRAATIVVLPLIKLGSIVILVLQPIVSRAAAGWSKRQTGRILRGALGLSAGLGMLAALLLLPIMPPLVRFAFRDPLYGGHVYYFYVVALTTVFFVLVDASVNIVFRAKRRFDLIFWPALLSGVTAGIFGIVGVGMAGVEGAAAALIASTLIFVPATIVACVMIGSGKASKPDDPMLSTPRTV